MDHYSRPDWFTAQETGQSPEHHSQLAQPFILQLYDGPSAANCLSEAERFSLNFFTFQACAAARAPPAAWIWSESAQRLSSSLVNHINWCCLGCIPVGVVVVVCCFGACPEEVFSWADMKRGLFFFPAGVDVGSSLAASLLIPKRLCLHMEASREWRYRAGKAWRVSDL